MTNAQVPEYFAEDLFSVLGNRRPDYRWLIVGPPKSGSSFHKVAAAAQHIMCCLIPNGLFSRLFMS